MTSKVTQITLTEIRENVEKARKKGAPAEICDALEELVTLFEDHTHEIHTPSADPLNPFSDKTETETPS